MAESNQEYASFGYSVSSAGDVNGDHYSDVVVGASAYDNGELDEGAIFLYYGSANGLGTTVGWMAEGNQVWSNFGIAVRSAGDENGDGFSDFIVAAHQFDHGEENEGRVYLYNGSKGLLPMPTSFNKSWPVNHAVGLSTNPTLTWDVSQYSFRYEYCYDTRNDNFCTVWVPVPNTGVILSGLAYNATYYWQVRAINSTACIYADGSETAYGTFTTMTQPATKYWSHLPITMR